MINSKIRSLGPPEKKSGGKGKGKGRMEKERKNKQEARMPEVTVVRAPRRDANVSPSIGSL